MEFSIQEYCRGLPFPSPADLPIPGMEPGSPTLKADFFLQSEPPGKPFLLLQSTGTRACGLLVVVAHVLNSWSLWAPEHVLSSCDTQAQLPCGIWDSPGPGIKPVSLALQGGFLTIESPGKPQQAFFWFQTLCSSLSHVWFFVTPWTVQPARLFCPWDFPGKDTGVGCHLLLQGIFPTQGSNLGLLHCSQTLYHLSY